MAEPVASPSPAPSSHDRNGTGDASDEHPGKPHERAARSTAEGGAKVNASPWIDQAPRGSTLFVRAADEENSHAKLASALTLGALYAGFVTWTYFAWYRRDSHAFKAGGDGLFSPNTYAAGADKMGHAWATLGLGRWGTEILRQWGGYSRTTSALVGNGLSQLLFLGVEIKDGFVYQFSYGDFAFNTAGALLGFAQSMWPRVDDLVDFKVEYFPSDAYLDRARKYGDVDIAEDYSGQTYLLAVHLGAIPGAPNTPIIGRGLPYVDLSFGFETRGYKPDPLYKIDPADPEKQDFPKRQTWFVGLSLNVQGVFDRLLRGRSEPLRKISYATFEMFAVPYTTLRGPDATYRPTGTVPDEQN